MWVPIHQTNAALTSSSLWFKIAYLQQLSQMPGLTADQKPEYRWMVDPDDYLKPMVYDPEDVRWTKRRRVREDGGEWRPSHAVDDVATTMRPCA